MTAIEKEKISFHLAKVTCKFLNKSCRDLSYRDLTKITLENARTIVQMCVRYGVKGCRKNAAKARKVTFDIFREYGAMTDQQRKEHYSLQGDNDDEQPANEEDKPCK